MDNPFIYGEVVRGEFFADRKQEIAELVNDLSRGQNLIIFSPRRFGKTSLILEVLETLKTKGLLTVYIDLYRITSKEKFVTAFAKAISQSYTGRIQKVLSEVRKIFPRLIPKIVIKGENIAEIEFSYDRSTVETPVIDDLLEAVNDIAQKKKTKATIVFDEFQEITNWDDGEIERQMRSHFQMHRDVAYVFMGSKRHLMTEIFSNRNRPFYRFGKHFPLGKIPRNEFVQFILQKFQKGGFRISVPAVEKILLETENHPYYTQLLCNILWDRFYEAKVIETEDIDKGIEEVLKRESHAYNDTWDTLTIRSKQLLEAIAVEPSSQIYSMDFLRRHSLGSPSSIQRAVKYLERLEIIERENDNYRFTDIFFKQWLKKVTL